MIKKAFTIFFFLWAIQIIVIACCPKSTRFFDRITGLQVANYNIQTEQVTDEFISQENYRIRLTISGETYTDNSFNPYFMVNAAYALDCEDIYEGLESDITDLSITCNKDILDTNAGEPIDYNKINVYKFGFFNDSDNQRRTIQNWIDIMNNGGHLLAFEWFFEFNDTIDSSEELKFKIKIIHEDYTEFEVETSPIRIE